MNRCKYFSFIILSTYILEVRRRLNFFYQHKLHFLSEKSSSKNRTMDISDHKVAVNINESLFFSY